MTLYDATCRNPADIFSGFFLFHIQNTDQSNGAENQSYTSMDVTDSHHQGSFAIPVRRDYNQFPLLQGNPSPGEKIAFKVHYK